MIHWYERDHAPAPGTFLCNASEIGENQAKEFRFGGSSPFAFRMFIYNNRGDFRAYRNACPHFDVPLNFEPGRLFTPDGQHFLCMTHHAIFDKASGLCVTGPCQGESLETIPLARDGDRVLVGEFME